MQCPIAMTGIDLGLHTRSLETSQVEGLGFICSVCSVLDVMGLVTSYSGRACSGRSDTSFPLMLNKLPTEKAQ
jgi:hypothetical protein